MKKSIIMIVLMVIGIVQVLAEGDLQIELDEPQFLPREGYSQTIFLPYEIKNTGDESITSRFGVKQIVQNQREGISYPLYIYTGNLKIEGITYPKGVPIIKKDGSMYFQKHKTIEIPDETGIIKAPGVTLQPDESLPFKDQGIMAMALVSFSESGTYTVGYEVDPLNEVQESDETNNKATITLKVDVPTYSKGPTKDLEENQYWFYFKKEGDCLTLPTKEPTNICLKEQGTIKTTLIINDQEVTLYHLWNWWGFSKQIGNIEFIAADGFLATEL